MKNSTLSGLQDYKVLDTEEEWILYHNNFSLCSRKARICLDELSIKAQLKHIHIMETKDCENLTKEFLKINPVATVPVLLHFGAPIYESHEQITYLENHCSNKLSQGDVVDYWIKKGSLIGEPDKNLEQYAGNCISIFTVPLFVSMLRNISILKYIKYLFKHPDRFRASKFLAFKMLAYRIFKKGSPIFKIIKSASNNLNNHFKELDDHLERKSWIDGDNFSLADITWMVLFHRLSEVFLLDYFFEDKNNLKSYFDRLKKRDSYQTALLDYESDEIRMGKLNLEFELDNNKDLNFYYKTIKL